MLNELEIQYILLRCEGLTNKEAADRMFRSARTIDGYRDNIFQKLQCKNMVQVVAKLFREGHIR